MKRQQQKSRQNLAEYCKLFSQLKVNRNKKRGEALNKPILLLSVIELIAQGLIQTNHIPISDELINTFKRYWDVLGSETFKGSDLALPFFHLKNEDGKFWHLQYSSKYDGGRPQSIPKLRNDVDYAYLDGELFHLLQDQIYRQELTDALIAAWFASGNKNIEDILEVNQISQNNPVGVKEEVTNDQPTLNEDPKFYLKKSVIRNSFFRKAVVHLYDYKCAFCNLKVMMSLTQSIIDGAHIKPFSRFYDSRIDNGISFCKNHHWAFDRGWFCIDDRYEIIISSQLTEESPHAKPMKSFEKKIISLPNEIKYHPRIESLQWHRKNIFIP
ncbi:MAG: HNH endonuclease [Kastovskya adunca ATA6-11-RM4]|jgi:putative restriction endonuclease|nr:HNH endonuclease [Kastovskya adunca ATA6-11-RM4]